MTASRQPSVYGIVTAKAGKTASFAPSGKRMRVLRYKGKDGPRLAVLDGPHIVDLLDGAKAARLDKPIQAWFTTMTAFIEAGRPAIKAAEKAVAASRVRRMARKSLAGVKLLPPIEASLILCSGENYWDHRDEKPKVEGQEPEFFTKTALGMIGSGEPIVLDPKVTRKLDYETELVVVIGKKGRHIPRDKAKDHIFGYTIMNDVTARDRQVRMRPDGTPYYVIGPGKNFDTCAPMGPWIVTKDEIPDPQRLRLTTRVNGEIRQNNTTDKMIWDCAELVRWFSVFLTLKPGVVISTGTPGGTAWATDPELGGRGAKRDDIVRPKGYLKPGDEVSCEIEAIGTLRNKVVAAP